MEFRGKKIILRVDFNSPVVNGKIVPGERMRLHAKTVRMLMKKGARIIMLSHQGRKGGRDFLPLDQHARAFSKIIGKKVIYVDSVADEKAIEAIDSLKNGGVLLLGNVRSLDEEIKKPKNAKYVKVLSSHADFYMNDAFSVSHRNQASVVGFPRYLPSAPGPNLERELKNLSKFIDHPGHPSVYILGGAKAEEDLSVAEYVLKKKKCDTILACGIFGEVMLEAFGFDLGAKSEFFSRGDFKSIRKRARKLHKKYSGHFAIPADLAVKRAGKRKEISVKQLPYGQMTKDIGSATLRIFSEYINEARIIVMKGPAGVYEDPAFRKGTRGLLKEVAASKAYSLVGGGHLTTAIDELKISPKKFTFVSSGGGSLIMYLSGHELPGVKALKIKY